MSYEICMNLNEIIDSLRTEDLVSQFKRALKDAGVEIAEDPVAKYFAAETVDATLLVLAHESTLEKGWWGIHSDIVERAKNSERVKMNHVGWGAVLLHKSFQRGYWIRGDDIFRMKTLCRVTLGKEGQYHFNGDSLENSPEFANQFFSVKTFLKLSGLQKS